MIKLYRDFLHRLDMRKRRRVIQELIRETNIAALKLQKDGRHFESFVLRYCTSEKIRFIMSQPPARKNKKGTTVYPNADSATIGEDIRIKVFE